MNSYTAKSRIVLSFDCPFCLTAWYLYIFYFLKILISRRLNYVNVKKIQ